MIPFDTFITFFTASIILALVPGPDNIFVLTQSAVKGKAAGLAVMSGLCTGLLFHTTAVALGIAVIFKTSAIAFTAVKFAGAAYLLWLAWQSFRAGSEKISSQTDNEVSLLKLYGRGIIMNITNPKVSIFFLAFLPQFAEPARGSVTIQILMLGGLFIVSTILIFGSVALLAGSIGRMLNKSGKIQTIMNKTAGVVFIGLAIKLAMVKQ